MKKLGFLGTGWIGRHRMAAMLDTGLATAVAICDPSADCLADAAVLAPNAVRVRSLKEMLALDLDGIVIATPSALHAVQSVQVLEAGVAVFCQKPLGRDLAETQGVIDAARKADRLLGVDLSYRHTDAMRAIAPLVAGGDLGKVFAVDLTFHNAYGPDKPWFYDPAQSGGGCVVDLGVHLVDLALWALGFPEVTDVSATLLSAAAPLKSGLVEDYAVASFVAGGVSVRLGCSWRLHAGRDAVIEAASMVLPAALRCATLMDRSTTSTPSVSTAPGVRCCQRRATFGAVARRSHGSRHWSAQTRSILRLRRLRPAHACWMRSMPQVCRKAEAGHGRLSITSLAARMPLCHAPCAVEKSVGCVASPAKKMRSSIGRARIARAPAWPGRA